MAGWSDAARAAAAEARRKRGGISQAQRYARSDKATGLRMGRLVARKKMAQPMGIGTARKEIRTGFSEGKARAEHLAVQSFLVRQMAANKNMSSKSMIAMAKKIFKK